MMCDVKFLVLCLTLFVRSGSAQEELEMDTQTETDQTTDLICSICACSEDLIDCANRKIRSPFQDADWLGLKPHNPVKVDLSQNSLDFITQVPELPIQELNVSDCQLDHVQEFAFSNLANLSVLDLSKNRITTSVLSRRTFERPQLFVKMRTLSLAANDIHSLPQDLFTSMPDLTFLDLSQNPLAYIDQLTMAVIVELTKLKELKLNGCELESLPEGLFRRMRRLERLDLSDNRFTTPPAVLAEATNLLYLRFNKNPVVSLDESTSLSSLTKLKELHICRHSKLESIAAGALGGLESLTKLKICFNPRLTTVDPGFLMWIDDHDVERYPLLEMLHLNNNNLSVINSHFVDRWDRLTDIDVSSNPYQCDCHAQWMLTVLVQLIASTQSNSTVAEMNCKKPQDLRGLSFAKLHEMSQTLTCAESDNLTDVPPPDAAIILGIMIGIFVTFPLVLIVVLLWRKGYFQKCRRKMNRDKHYYDEDEAL